MATVSYTSNRPQNDGGILYATICVYTHLYICLYIMYAYINSHTYINTYTDIYTYVYIYTHMYIHIYVYIPLYESSTSASMAPGLRRRAVGSQDVEGQLLLRAVPRSARKLGKRYLKGCMVHVVGLKSIYH